MGTSTIERTEQVKMVWPFLLTTEGGDDFRPERRARQGHVKGEAMMDKPAAETGRTMEALRAQARGGPESLIYDERVLPPSPGIGDVLLEVRAASFTPTELEWPSTWVDRAG